jgi:isoquinoline 1-oxidoreductase beta subunit
MNAIINLSRRNFLKTSALVGGGLILGVHLPGLARAAQQGGSPFPLNAFVRIAQDDTVTVIVNHSEMGQGPYTSMPMMVAEELDADWSKVRYEAAPVAPEYNHSVYPMQLTGGSTSTWSEYTSEPFACEAKDGKIVVTSHLVGNFPGSPVDLRYFFKLEGDKIASLEIIP